MSLQWQLMWRFLLLKINDCSWKLDIILNFLPHLSDTGLLSYYHDRASDLAHYAKLMGMRKCHGSYQLNYNVCNKLPIFLPDLGESCHIDNCILLG